MKYIIYVIFILLHGQYEKEYYVNVDMIRSFWDLDDGSVGKDKAIVQYSNGDTQFVRETSDDITLLIKDEVSRQRTKDLTENHTTGFAHVDCSKNLYYCPTNFYQ